MARPIPPLDVLFLGMDRDETPANVGALMLFDVPQGRAGRGVARRIVRAFRAARPTAPFDCVPEFPALALPLWRTVTEIDMRHLVRYERFDAPADPAALFDRVAALHRDRLDRTRPLFELHVIDGLASGQVAIYLKSHHASWDGRSALARVLGMLGKAPGPIGTPFFALPGQPPPQPAASITALADGARSLLQHAFAGRELLAAAARRRARSSTAGLAPAANRPFAGPQTRFNRTLAAGRSCAGFSLPIEEMRRIGRLHGGTINDVVLAVVDAGVARYLANLGECPREPLVAMCPVSIRDEGDVEATTKVATMFVPLATPRAGAARRLRQIVTNTAAAKQEFHSLSRAAALDYALLAFGVWFASHTLGLEAITRPVVNLVVSNVGGLPGEHYLGDLRLASVFPISMIAEPAGLNVSAVSIAGRMDFGIVADRSAVPDAGEIASHCLAAWALLRRATRAQELAPGSAP